jgi:pSer/pThr/pTyr-binding forkhead associated (FHA) protein
MDDLHTRRDEAHSSDFQPMRLRLHPGGHAIDLTRPDVLLGRHSEADLRMPQPDVSRQHCRFVFSDLGWQLIDLDSLNGVYVNGARIRRASVLRPGDHIRICGVEFDVEAVGVLAPEEPVPEFELLRNVAATLDAEALAPQRRAS